LLQQKGELIKVEIDLNVRFAPEAALGRLEIQLPLYPRKQTQLVNRGKSGLGAFLSDV
jgi:hypothetical protein